MTIYTPICAPLRHFYAIFASHKKINYAYISVGRVYILYDVLIVLGYIMYSDDSYMIIILL